MRILKLIIPSLAFFAASAHANDGFLGLPAGGLTLQKSENIRMLEEDLFLSLDEVRVNYQFRNESYSPIRARIGFTMPGLPVSVNFDADDGFDLHNVKSLELLKFETRGEGARVVSQPVVRAFIYPQNIPYEKRDHFRFTDAIDVTAELTSAGVPLNFDAAAIKRAFARLSATRKADWIRRGLYFKDAYTDQPGWWLSTIFVREQVFPPGAVVRVQHRYKPYPSGFIMMSNQLQHDRVLAKATCVDAQTERAVARILPKDRGGVGHVIDYVLTTAKTWKGPIGRFRMTVDKAAAANVVSFCANGVRKTGPTTFVFEATNFVPAQDIKVLIVKPPG